MLDNTKDLIEYDKLLAILNMARSVLNNVPASEHKAGYVSSGWLTLEEIVYDIETIMDELECCINTFRDLAKIYKRTFCTLERGATWVNFDEFPLYYEHIKSLDKAYIAVKSFAMRESLIDDDTKTFKGLNYRLQRG